MVDQKTFEAWAAQFQFIGGNRESREFSIVSFVTELNISKEEFTNAIHNFVQKAKENGSDIQPAYTNEEIQAIYGLQTQINEIFVSEYSILQNDTIYTPEWLYTHRVDEYQAEGLSPQEVRSKISFYEKIPFTPDAEEAFSQKLQAYTGQGLKTEASCPPVEVPSAPPVPAGTTPPPF